MTAHLGFAIAISKTTYPNLTIHSTQGPFSHCQGPLGWETAIRGSYSTSIVRIRLVPATEHVTVKL